MDVMQSPDTSTSASALTPEMPSTLASNATHNENCSNLGNTNFSERKYVVPHPHETSLDYNLRAQWERPGKLKCTYVTFLKLNCIVAGNSVGASDFPWTDCRILDKFYEKHVLWSHIECRFFNGIFPFVYVMKN